MAQLLQVHVNTVYADLRDFAQHGLSFLHRPRRVGAPPRLSQGQIDTIWRLASQPPTTLGLPFGRWTVAKLRDYFSLFLLHTGSRVSMRPRLSEQSGHRPAIRGRVSAGGLGRLAAVESQCPVSEMPPIAS